ncbi:type II CRISPR RNA-guided endonuclease Cas9 [Prevotella sp.]|uniref:type II CRISPR RNA-guided endonuclease Cas9 n=1 Tax=Prevotella sp. TaxID=59823 RepID=UPI003F822EDF
MKKILGLDLGTTSIGWAFVTEAENEKEKSSIIKLGVRVNPLTVDEQTNFEKGKAITTNADRTLKRTARRNLQRYKLRRENLISLLKKEGFITEDSVLCEKGNNTTFETRRLRAKAVTEEISLEELARVLIMLNKKRGYKSSRKANSGEEGNLIDGMTVARKLYDEHLTPGQYTYQLLCKGKKYIPDFYPSDLIAEFEAVWNCQKQIYADVLTDELREALRDKNEKQTWAICAAPLGLKGIKRSGTVADQRVENYRWRTEALTKQLSLEQVVIVLQKINSQIRGTSGYLGAISDRSKELYFNHLTVGQFQMKQLSENPNISLKNQVFYRQDYLDEFERIWEKQAKFHKELTEELKHELRDIIIFYQRPLKSQKSLISYCEFESSQKEVVVDGKKNTITIGLRVCPKSSPLFQCFKIWQSINNLQITGNVIPKQQLDLFGDTTEFDHGTRILTEEEKLDLYRELSIKESLSEAEIIKLLFGGEKGLSLNFHKVEGNHTMATFIKACHTILVINGYNDYDFSKISYDKTIAIITPVFDALGFKSSFLNFNPTLEGKGYERQDAYRLWHLLYSYSDDNSATGNEKLVEQIGNLLNMDKESAAAFASITYESDYGSLSSKAMRRILPHMMDGLEYSVACEYAGYRHSRRSLTKEEIMSKPLVDTIPLLPRNSLRNPVVEKILNQMINVVNAVSESYGKPDEIRIEMARELKKSATEREQMTRDIARASAENDKYRKVLQEEFNIQNVSRNDIIRYRLYLELEANGFKTLYTQTYIPREKLFSKEFDIEHIIPQARLFDDSFSNKTLEARSANIEKGSTTAYDYVLAKYGEHGSNGAIAYKERIDHLYKDGKISKTKHDKLLMTTDDIPDGFINRDLRDTQYIARKAREILESAVRVVVPTTGSVTDRLREDWQLVDVMKELNWDKYDQLGLTEIVKDNDGRQIRRIKDWTKRNDHRHHAMDALTIAFTRHSYIQYLNNLNARSDKGGSIYAIEKKELYRDKNNKLRFIPPMPLGEFRVEARRHLENVLISIKAKNKVVTRNVNITCGSDGKTHRTVQLTPRGQLHNETVYGHRRQCIVKEEKVGSAFNKEKINTVSNPQFREALLRRYAEFGDAKKAFTGKNSLDKNPIYLNDDHTKQVPQKVKTVTFEEVFTIRKPIDKDLNIDKVVDARIREILQQRLSEYGDDAKKAFANLDENPIWLNRERGIAIKRVTIYGVSNAIALHDRRDMQGNKILKSNGTPTPADYVSTSNNHHVAIFLDEKGNLQEHVVSFFEATERSRQHQPIVDREYNKHLGWQFLFTMKRNEYFVFPNEKTGFNPNEIDLLDPNNAAEISKNLFRVQKLTSKDYFFRLHLETNVDTPKELSGITYARLSLKGIVGIVKVRINHLGQIVAVGEY